MHLSVLDTDWWFVLSLQLSDGPAESRPLAGRMLYVYTRDRKYCQIAKNNLHNIYLHLLKLINGRFPPLIPA